MALVFLGALLDAPGATARAALLPDVVELAGRRMERASGIRGRSSRARSSSARRSAACSSPRSARRRALARRRELPRLRGARRVFVPRPASASPEEEPGSFFAELAEGCGSSGDQRLLRASSLMVLLTNLIEAPFPVVTAVLRRGGVRQRDRPRSHVSASSEAAALVGALVYSAIGHRCRDGGRSLLLLGGPARLPGAGDPALAADRTRRARPRRARAGPINPLLFTVTTEIVPSDLRGRVFGAVRAGAGRRFPSGSCSVASSSLRSGSPRRSSRSACSSRWSSPTGSSTPRSARWTEGTRVILVEGVSDQRALEALAARHGRDLEAEGVAIVPIGGAHAVGRAPRAVSAPAAST